ncbi:TELO2-interacting protein 1 homolog [Clytia hemisphaerica]|uniref:TELO2-interacting protein 1 homolog n=1 Tax=Clytia hemisphaerica TaxID=252671 RepID=UPI0034D3CD7F
MYCNYDSLSDLILFNSDYLIDAVTLQFRHIMIDSAAPGVLAVILRLCDKDIMPIVCDSAADVFRLLDEYQEEIDIQMLEILAVNKWFCSNKNETGSTVDSDMKLKNLEPTDVLNDGTSAVDFFTQYTKVLQQAHGNIEYIDEEAINGNDDDGGEGDEKEEEDKEDQIPLHFDILIKVCILTS